MTETRETTTGIHPIRVHFGTNFDVEIKYMATVIHCPEEGDGYSEPRVDDIEPWSITLYENGEEVGSTNSTAALALAQHVLDHVDPQEILRELNPRGE